MIYFVYDILSISLNSEQAREMELKLNITTKGHIWKKIGDYLYDFHTGKTDNTIHHITFEQFNFLNKHFKYSFDECRYV
jgi:hypothetical protein